MALLAKEESESRFDPIPPGEHEAICVAVYDLGTQLNETFNVYKRQVLITWELPDVIIEVEDKETGELVEAPRFTSKFYTLSLHEKANLRQDLEGWRSKEFTEKELEGFDILKLLGVGCRLHIIHRQKNNKTYANIKTILPLAKDMWREPENPMRSFSFDDDGTDLPEGMPDWVKEIIQKSEEWHQMTTPGEDITQEYETPPLESYDDDIPF